MAVSIVAGKGALGYCRGCGVSSSVLVYVPWGWLLSSAMDLGGLMTGSSCSIVIIGPAVVFLVCRGPKAPLLPDVAWLLICCCCCS